MGMVPMIGGDLQQIVVGGADYGHYTLTRFFALHAGVLPGLLVLFLVLHVAIFRRHGIHARIRRDEPTRTFWPDQVLKDAVACLAVLAVVLFFVLQAGHLSDDAHAPTCDWAITWAPNWARRPTRRTSIRRARPEWYFLFLFQFLKYFPGRLRIHRRDRRARRGDGIVVPDADRRPLEAGASVQHPPALCPALGRRFLRPGLIDDHNAAPGATSKSPAASST